MPKVTPFHDALAPYNETGIWKHWFGTLAAPRYQYSATVEYPRSVINPDINFTASGPIVSRSATNHGCNVFVVTTGQRHVSVRDISIRSGE